MRWQEMPEGKEKYSAYLCSREWSVLKQAVHDRADGLCERCFTREIEAVHHMSYARKYAERLGDLQGLCNGCHAFTHGKTDVDPRDREEREVRFLRVFDRQQDLYVDLGEYVAGLAGSIAISISRGICDPDEVRSVIANAIVVGMAMRKENAEAANGV